MGKSLFMQVLIHLYQEMGTPYTAFDADTETRTVLERYPQVTQLLEISDSHFRNTDVVYERMEMGETVLVDLPSGSFQSVQNWFERDDLFRLIRDLRKHSPNLDYQVVHWFLSDVSPISLNKFIASVDYYQGRMEHVLVKNLGKIKAVDWEQFSEGASSQEGDVDTLQAVLALDWVSEIVFPRLIKPYGFDRSNLTFAQALRTVNQKTPRLFVLDRQKVATFLKRTRQQLEQTNLLDRVLTPNV